MNREDAIETLEMLERVQRDALGRGDVLVLTVRGRLSEAAKDRIDMLFKEVWPNNRVVVLDDGAELKVVAAEEPA